MNWQFRNVRPLVELGRYKRHFCGTCALVGFLVVLLFAFQHLTLIKFSKIPAGAGLVCFSDFARQVTAEIAFSTLDFTLFVGIVVVFTTLGAIEGWYRSLTRLLNSVFKTERRTLFVLAIVCLTLVRFYFAAGQFSWAGDASGHIIYAKIAADSFASGEIPIWTNVFSAGSPYLQFYGFLFFYLAGLLDFLCGDLFNGLKIITGLSHGLSGATMYLLARTATGSRAAGLVAGISYVGSFWHTQQVMIMGRLPLSIIYLVLPLPFYALERLRTSTHESVAKSVVGGSAAMGILTFTHPGYAFWSMVFFFIYLGARVWATRDTEGAKFGLSGAAILFFGGAFGACLTIPMWLERAHTGLVDGVNLSDLPAPTWENIFVWSNGYFRLLSLSADSHNWHGGYIGLSLVIAVLVWGVYTFRSRSSGGKGVGAGTALGLALSWLLVFGHQWPGLAELSVVQAFNAGRYLLFAVFFLAMGAGIGAGRAYKSRRPRMYTILLFLIIVDVGSTSFRQLYIPRWAQPIEYPKELLRSIAEEVHTDSTPHSLPAYRLFATTRRAHTPLLVSWIYAQTGIPGLQALYNEAPLSHWEFIRPWIDLVQLEPNGAKQSADDLLSLQENLLVAGARLLNVREILDDSWGTGSIARIRPGTTSPVIAASTITPYPEENLAKILEHGEIGAYRIFQEATSRSEFLKRTFPVYWIIGMMELNPQANTCKRIFVRNHEAVKLGGENPLVELVEHTVHNQKVDLQIRVSEPCFIRLAYSYYPYLKVTVDGREVRALETAGHFIALPMEAGEHRIVIIPHLSSLRRGLVLMSLCLLFLGVLWIYMGHRVDKRYK